MNVADGASVNDFINALNNGELKDENGNSLKVNASFNSDTGKIEFDIQAIGEIKINDSNLLTKINENTDFNNENRLQKAQDAVFTYNGVEVQRSSNEIEDLIPGVKIKLNTTGSSSVSINNNVDEIVEAMKKFVADYNAMVSNLQNLTTFDKDAGTVGLFQGDSNFTMLSSIFSNDIFSSIRTYNVDELDRNGNSYTKKALFSAANLGLSMNKNGMLSFDESKFRETYNENPELTSNFMQDIFSRVKNDFDRTITGDHSNLSLLEDQIKNEEKSYQDRIDSMNKYLETKYEIMAKQFAAYDEMINNFTAMSQSLNMAIEQAINSKH
jgi:flagellar hook-associated protein 2